MSTESEKTLHDVLDTLERSARFYNRNADNLHNTELAARFREVSTRREQTISRMQGRLDRLERAKGSQT